jgi:hypothetical protein
LGACGVATGSAPATPRTTGPASAAAPVAIVAPSHRRRLIEVIGHSWTDGAQLQPQHLWRGLVKDRRFPGSLMIVSPMNRNVPFAVRLQPIQARLAIHLTEAPPPRLTDVRTLVRSVRRIGRYSGFAAPRAVPPAARLTRGARWGASPKPFQRSWNCSATRTRKFGSLPLGHWRKLKPGRKRIATVFRTDGSPSKALRSHRPPVRALLANPRRSPLLRQAKLGKGG